MIRSDEYYMGTVDVITKRRIQVTKSIIRELYSQNKLTAKEAKDLSRAYTITYAEMYYAKQIKSLLKDSNDKLNQKAVENYINEMKNIDKEMDSMPKGVFDKSEIISPLADKKYSELYPTKTNGKNQK